jgi:hypothetical protein
VKHIQEPLDAFCRDLLICGVPEVDVAELKNEPGYWNYPMIQLFWEIIAGDCLGIHEDAQTRDDHAEQTQQGISCGTHVFQPTRPACILNKGVTRGQAH